MRSADCELACNVDDLRGTKALPRPHFHYPKQLTSSSKGLYGAIPPFALGRAAFDNWLVWRARTVRAIVVDATPVVTAVHQQHDYSHVPGGRIWAYEGVEAKRNLALGGGWAHHRTLRDAHYTLTQRAFPRKLGSTGGISTRWWLSRLRARRRAAQVSGLVSRGLRRRPRVS